MEHQNRIWIITSRLNIFLRQYQKPAHLDNETSLAEMKVIADEINSLISASSNQDGLAATVDECFRILRQSYKRREWPMPAHFVEAMNAAQKKATTNETTGRSLDPVDIAAKRMNAGEAVSDGWLYGKGALTLLDEGRVDEDTMRRYRSALYFSARNVGKGDATDYADALEARMLERHADAQGCFKPRGAEQ